MKHHMWLPNWCRQFYGSCIEPIPVQAKRKTCACPFVCNQIGVKQNTWWSVKHLKQNTWSRQSCNKQLSLAQAAFAANLVHGVRLSVVCNDELSAECFVPSSLVKHPSSEVNLERLQTVLLFHNSFSFGSSEYRKIITVALCVELAVLLKPVLPSVQLWLEDCKVFFPFEAW